MRTKINSVYEQYTLAFLCVFAVGVAIRLLPLYWTPYPFNPDGFMFAAGARDAIAAGSVPAPDTMGSQQYGFVLLLVTLSQITSLEPLWIAQPTIAVIGTLPALLATLLVREFGSEFDWPARRTFIASSLAGLVLATEGLYLRRSVAVSYEVLGLLLIPTVALCIHRFFESTHRSWLGAAGVLLFALPLTHHLSTVVTAVTLTVLVSIWIDHQPTRLVISTGVAIVLGFWLYLSAYYTLFPTAYYGLIRINAALFIAWIIIIVSLAHCLQVATPNTSRQIIGCIIILGFGIFILNTIQPIFPGTSPTPPLLLALVAPLMVLTIFAIWGLPIIVRSTHGLLVLALFIAPISFIGISLTAGLSPQYSNLVQRSQTFVHFGTIIIAVIGLFSLYDRTSDYSQTISTVIRVGLPITFILVAVITTPIAFVGLEALSYQGTTTEAEFSTATFASTAITEPWTSDDHITRIQSNYYQSQHNRGAGPVYNWLQGSTPPTCPTVVQKSWTTVGAQLFPSPPKKLSEDTYVSWRSNNNVIYVSGSGKGQIAIVTSSNDSTKGC